MTVASSKVSTKSAINGISQKARDQFRQIINLFIRENLADIADPRQV